MQTKSNFNTNDKPILVTGSHRCGSTWVGKMISESPLVGYIREPFNINHRPGICKANFDYWFTYICETNADLYKDALSSCLNFQYQFLEALKTLKKPKDIVYLIRDLTLFTNYKIYKKRPLIKDPIAFFSSAWLAKEFNMDVVVLIRHPAAFVGSLKKAKWDFPFGHFVAQPLLMNKYLNQFEEEIKEFALNKKDIVHQGILLWKIIHYTILKYQEKYPNWIFAKHEELSKDPINEFSQIFYKLDLPYSDEIRCKIKKFSNSDNLVQTDNRQEIKRNSKLNIKSWKSRLSKEEIELIRKKTFPLYTKFYHEQEWDD